MGKRLKPTVNSARSPFRDNFGEKVGAGQDNIVRAFEAPAAGHLVVKISQQKGEVSPSTERAKTSALYKKKKYEILKMFLGDFIPESAFVIGEKTDGLRDPIAVPKSYTVQKRVPNVKIEELPIEARRDPRLLHQMYMLVLKLQNMYETIDELHDAIGVSELDGKLDLGGISKFAKNEYDPRNFDAGEVVNRFKSSANLLVDPDTMKLYCVDFDDGEWSISKEAAKGVLEHYVLYSPDIQEAINA